MQGFLEALDQRVLVCDGATGTMLYAKGVFLNRCFDELNVTQSELVADVHREYLRAGADVIETNTFGANRIKLVAFGLAEQAAEINREGARLARRAAQGRAWVAGAIGPLGIRIEPWGRTSTAEAEAVFREQAQALADGGVDLFILETFSDLSELLAAIRAVRTVSPLPLIAQLTTGEDGQTVDGTPPEDFTPALDAAGADVIGLNCSVGPAAMLETIEAMARLSSSRLAAQPNAGRPRDVDGRNLYLSSPEYMASYARRFVAAGVRLVGGCCGTTPEHTRQIAQAVRSTAPGARRAVAAVSVGAPAAAPTPVVARRDKSELARALADKRFAVLVDINAPRGLHLAAAATQAKRFHDRGAVAVNIPDYPRSGARASALALASVIEQAGVETLLHCTCRDRTLLGLQSDLVGAHAMGIRNVLLTTGSPARTGNYPEATSVYEVDAIGLINVAHRLNQGLDVAGQALDGATEFHIGATINPFPADEAAEWRRLERKIEAGAEFLVTPPILDLEAFAPVAARLRGTGLPVLAGVAMLDSARHAEVLSSEVVGARASDAVLDRLRGAGDQAAEAAALTAEIVEWLRERTDGLLFTWLHGTATTAEQLLDAIAARLHGVPLSGRTSR
jgi:methionine synthase / methylenetetrahydrofolate reductase(NADPH)